MRKYIISGAKAIGSVVLFLLLCWMCVSVSYCENNTWGTNAGKALTSGADNVFGGDYAGFKDSTGSANTFVGQYAGYPNTTGRGNVMLGYMAGYAATATTSNKLYINNGFYPSYGIFGDFATGFFGINKAAPTVALDITGDAKLSGTYYLGTITGSDGAVTIVGALKVTNKIAVTGTITGLSLVHNITAAADTFYTTTTPYASAAANCISGVTFVAQPIAQKSTLFLQGAVAGAEFDVIVGDADSLRIVAASGDSIYVAGVADRSVSTVVGTAKVKSTDGVRWFVTQYTGTWTLDHGVQ
jgi:hypothetical protein